MGAERRGYLPGVPEFKGKIKPSKESNVKRREFKNSPDNKFDRDNSLVGNAGDMEADITAEKTRKSEVAADLKVAREGIRAATKEKAEEAKWNDEIARAKAREKIEDITPLADEDLKEIEDFTDDVQEVA